jgi:tetratricopeptide (TPR) repeat protein
VSSLITGLLGALLATNPPAAVSNLVTQTTGLTVNVPDPSDPVEKEYHKLMTDDDAAQSEVDQWIRDNDAFVSKGGGMPADVLNSRIRTRFAPIRKAYEDFLKLHPDHARAHLAYGSFLNDLKEEEAAEVEFEKSRVLDPKNPAAWNNLANFYGHRGPVKKAFEYYEKAIELNPRESTYYQNLATMVYLFRKDARETYHLEEQQVFDKSLGLYRKAVELDPQNFALASELAQTYYGIKPFRTDEAFGAWTNALKIAGTEIEREGVYVHLARLHLHAGDYPQVHSILNTVTNELYDELKKRLLGNLAKQEKEAQTNTPPARVEIKQP